MKLRVKKIVAREVLILFSLFIILLVSWLALYTINYFKNHERYHLQQERYRILNERDSISSLILVSPATTQSNKPAPPSPEEYFSKQSTSGNGKSSWKPPDDAVQVSEWQPPEDDRIVSQHIYVTDSAEVELLKQRVVKFDNQIEEYNAKISSLTDGLDFKEILLWLGLTFCGIAYVFRPLIHLLKWSIRILKE